MSQEHEETTRPPAVAAPAAALAIPNKAPAATPVSASGPSRAAAAPTSPDVSTSPASGTLAAMPVGVSRSTGTVGPAATVARPAVEPKAAGGGAVDPWAALSAPDGDDDNVDDVDGPVVTLLEDDTEDDDDEVRDPADAYDGGDGDPALFDPGAEATLAADANAAAVEAAMLATTPPGPGAGRFTIPLLCAGIAVIAACLVIPQADANRRLAYERAKLRADLQAVVQQVETNDEFLSKVSQDPNLAERLAQRQMKIIREGNAVLSLKSDGDEEMSPFQLTAVPPPADLPPYQRKGGTLAELCYNPRSRLYLMGAGLFAIAAGLVLGIAPRADD